MEMTKQPGQRTGGETSTGRSGRRGTVEGALMRLAGSTALPTLFDAQYTASPLELPRSSTLFDATLPLQPPPSPTSSTFYTTFPFLLSLPHPLRHIALPLRRSLSTLSSVLPPQAFSTSPFLSDSLYPLSST
eukprot:2650271-Rhodomonas_salina.1